MSIAKRYAGEALPSVLSEALSISALTAAGENLSGYPPANFVISVTDGLSVERILMASRAGNTMTVYGPGTDAGGIAFSSGRGWDGTEPRSWGPGAVIKHVFDADSATFFNDQIADLRSDLDALSSLSGVTPDTLWKPGDIKPTATQALGTGWLWCDGAAVSRATYAALFTAIGTAFGAGNGTTTFNVPDLRGRFPLGANDMSGTPPVGADRVASTRGAIGGEANHTLSVGELTAHGHAASSGLMSADHGHSLSIGTGGQTADHSHNVDLGTTLNGDHSHGATEDWLFVTQGPATSGFYAAAMEGGNRAVGDVGATSVNGAHAHEIHGGTSGFIGDHAHVVDGSTAGASANHNHAITVDSTGDGAAHNNTPPYVGINYWVKT